MRRRYHSIASERRPQKLSDVSTFGMALSHKLDDHCEGGVLGLNAQDWWCQTDANQSL